jgi:hypothetical protein
MAMAGEAQFERERGQIIRGISRPFHRGAQSQTRQIAMKRRAGSPLEEARQVERRRGHEHDVRGSVPAGKRNRHASGARLFPEPHPRQFPDRVVAAVAGGRLARAPACAPAVPPQRRRREHDHVVALDARGAGIRSFARPFGYGAADEVLKVVRRQNPGPRRRIRTAHRMALSRIALQPYYLIPVTTCVVFPRER